jgi:hypothetical protein
MTPALLEDRIRSSAVVPEDLPVGRGERGDGQSQSARIGADEEIHMIMGQKAQDILLRELRLAPIIQGEQPEREPRPCGAERKFSLSPDVLNP